LISLPRESLPPLPRRTDFNRRSFFLCLHKVESLSCSFRLRALRVVSSCFYDQSDPPAENFSIRLHPTLLLSYGAGGASRFVLYPLELRCGRPLFGILLSDVCGFVIPFHDAIFLFAAHPNVSPTRFPGRVNLNSHYHRPSYWFRVFCVPPPPPLIRTCILVTRFSVCNDQSMMCPNALRVSLSTALASLTRWFAYPHWQAKPTGYLHCRGNGSRSSPLPERGFAPPGCFFF